MRIAQVSPLFESVPPKLYGGTERVVFDLTEALSQLGHEVTLFASGDSIAHCRRLIPGCSESLRLIGCREPHAAHALMFEMVLREEDGFDVIHFHTEYLHFNMIRRLATPHVSTLHGRLDLPEYRGLFHEFRDVPLVSISRSQCLPMKLSTWVRTVYHGIDPSRIKFEPRDEGYLAFLGRISPEKGVHHAIEIARKTGRKLKVAAKVEMADYDYYRNLSPLLHESFVEYVGEIGEHEKQEFLGGASALLFPIAWPEPFGLVMIESLAAGTPVIGFRSGAVPEIVRHGETGYVVASVEEACAAVHDLEVLDRRKCRADFEARFTRERMALDYLSVYQDVMSFKSLQGIDSGVRAEAPLYRLQARSAESYGGGGGI